MSTIVYKVKYRPLRVGWCVRDGDRHALVKAFRLSHCLWGGGHNPIVVVDNQAAAHRLIDIFKLDAIFPVSQDHQTRNFSTSIKHLPWPGFRQGLFDEDGPGRQCTLLDIYHPVRKLYEESLTNRSAPEGKPLFYKWAEEDSCADVFEAMLGNYPPPSETDEDYAEFVLKYTDAETVTLVPGRPIDIRILHALTPNVLTRLDLRSERSEKFGLGLFIAEATSFADLVKFWNLRAAGNRLFFVDQASADRFAPVVQELYRLVSASPAHPYWGPERLMLWSKRRMSEAELERFHLHEGPSSIGQITSKNSSWDDLDEEPFAVYFSQRETVAQISEAAQHPIVTIQLLEKPGFTEGGRGLQKLVVSLEPTLNYSEDDRFTYKVPYLPELNEHFGRKHHYGWDTARAEQHGVGIITDLGAEHISLWGMERFELAKAFFLVFGIEAELSQAGLICDQLIRQMGGPQGCRVFKISGVRKLIQEFGPTQTFTRSHAIQVIRSNDPATGHPKFDAYKGLHIEPRENGSLKPEHVFSYLLRRGVFRAGLDFRCPSCHLIFWRTLDDTKTVLACEYCGHNFNVTPQLKGEKWAFRPSGLFGRDDHQEGGVPVALTLQQLHTSFHRDMIFWLPPTRLQPISASITPCETDLVVCQQSRKGVQLLLGECKTNGEITEQDVSNLARVAEALQSDRIDVFILFSKAGQFSPEEIQRCKAADSPNKRRTILLSERELEPYFAYEIAEQEYDVSGHSVSLEGMVQATKDIFFNPQPKKVQPPGLTAVPQPKDTF